LNDLRFDNKIQFAIYPSLVFSLPAKVYKETDADWLSGCWNSVCTRMASSTD